MHFSPLIESDTIKEDDVFNAYDAVEYLKRKYNFLADKQVEIVSRARGNVSFIAICPNKDTDMQNLIADADRLGYYVGAKSYKLDGLRLWAVYHFEPKSQPNVRQLLSSHYEYLIHVTPLTNLHDIKRNGLIKKRSEKYENGEFAHPERIYFLTNESKKEAIKSGIDIAHVFYKQRKWQSKFAIICMKIDEIPDYVTMHYDGNVPDDYVGVFVEEDIPARCIDSIELYDCESGKFIRDSFWKKLVKSIKTIFK